ncbi:hypothetical protein PVN21_22205, partial [Bacillus licheniformis]
MQPAETGEEAFFAELAAEHHVELQLAILRKRRRQSRRRDGPVRHGGAIAFHQHVAIYDGEGLLHIAE